MGCLDEKEKKNYICQRYPKARSGRGIGANAQNQGGGWPELTSRNQDA